MSVNHLPSLSILLPCHNEAAKLPTQLAAIMAQLTTIDELILVDDGSTDDTIKVMGPHWSHPQVRGIRRPHKQGVNNAYNFCAAQATKEWVLGASGNDCIQPDAFAAFRRSALEWPQAKLIMGRELHGGYHPPEPIFYHPKDLAHIWLNGFGQEIHGCSTFVRREVWGRGYGAGEWLADWWHIWQLAIRHGMGYIPEIISSMGPAGYSNSHHDDRKYNIAMEQIRNECQSEACADISEQIIEFHKHQHLFDLRVPAFFFERGRKSFTEQSA